MTEKTTDLIISKLLDAANIEHYAEICLLNSKQYIDSIKPVVGVCKNAPINQDTCI